MRLKSLVKFIKLFWGGESCPFYVSFSRIAIRFGPRLFEIDIGRFVAVLNSILLEKFQ